MCCCRRPAFACEARAQLRDAGVGHVRARGARQVSTHACACAAVRWRASTFAGVHGSALVREARARLHDLRETGRGPCLRVCGESAYVCARRGFVCAWAYVRCAPRVRSRVVMLVGYGPALPG